MGEASGIWRHCRHPRVLPGHSGPRFPNGDRTMATTWSVARRLGVTAAALVLALIAVQVRAADDEEALRKKALELNKITGTKAVNEKLVALVKDPEGSKQLLKSASQMAKE